MLKQITFLALAFGACVMFNGCGQYDYEIKGGKSDSPEAPAEDAHAHPSEGPRGGHLIELGDCTYHAELLHDEATHTVTVHLLDAAGKQDVAVEAPEVALQLFEGGEFTGYALKPAGDATPASEFSLVDEALCDQLLHAHDLKGRLTVTIDGEQLVGVIEHDDHAHEGHDHGDEGDEAAGHDDDHAGHDDDSADHDHADHDHE